VGLNVKNAVVQRNIIGCPTKSVLSAANVKLKVLTNPAL